VLDDTFAADITGLLDLQEWAGKTYWRGDYWLVPARTLTGDVEWPQDTAVPRGFYRSACTTTSHPSRS
jgi:hypothetical protein